MVDSATVATVTRVVIGAGIVGIGQQLDGIAAAWLIAVTLVDPGSKPGQAAAAAASAALGGSWAMSSIAPSGGPGDCGCSNPLILCAAGRRIWQPGPAPVVPGRPVAAGRNRPRQEDPACKRLAHRTGQQAAPLPLELGQQQLASGLTPSTACWRLVAACSPPRRPAWTA